AEKLTCACDLGELTCAPRASARGVRSRLIASVPFETREVDMQFPRRSTTAVTIALVALLWLAAAGTRAADFPSRIIRVVVAFPRRRTDRFRRAHPRRQAQAAARAERHRREQAGREWRDRGRIRRKRRGRRTSPVSHHGRRGRGHAASEQAELRYAARFRADH